jgi:hypothetical protein
MTRDNSCNQQNQKEMVMPRKNRRQVSKSAAFIPAARTAEFNPDYTHIKHDLGRIGVLAGSFFVILIILTFFLH